jgi:predicted outer membrane protein
MLGATAGKSTVERRRGRFVPALLVLLSMSFVALGFAAPAASGDPVVSETDRQLLVKVRVAGLWQVPAAQAADQQADSDVIKQVGTKIAAQHAALGKETRELAQRLGVTLPTEPSEEQQGWVADLSAKVGAEFDTAFATQLRGADGALYQLAAQVRTGTRNESMRAFATKATDVVKTQMSLLESTGKVDFAALPEPTVQGAAPPAAVISHQSSLAPAAQGGGSVSVGLAILLCVLVFGMTLGVLRALRAR